MVAEGYIWSLEKGRRLGLEVLLHLFVFHEVTLSLGSLWRQLERTADVLLVAIEGVALV